MKKGTIIKITLIISVLLFFSISQKNRYPYWKIFYNTINTKQFKSLSTDMNGFVGMDINEVLKLVTKDDKCFVFSEDSICMGMTYAEIISYYPEIELVSPRSKLYCIAVVNPRSPEEVFPAGLFVNDNNIVVEPPIDVPLYW